MRLYTIGNFLRSAGRSLLRNSWMTIASVGSVIVGLLVFGMIMLLVWNVNYFATQVESELEITVFLEEEMTPANINKLYQDIKNMPGVTTVAFVSKDDALARMEERFGSESDLLAGLREDNVLWNTYEVKVEDAQLVGSLATSIQGLSGVDDVLYGREYVDKLLKVTRFLRVAGLGLMVALAIASTFIISNTIRITVFARRKEINIMKYVGATDWFIRWPFIIEGWFLGVLGALLAGGLLLVGYAQLAQWLGASIPFLSLLPTADIVKRLFTILFIIGSLLGIIGSTISLRRFLRV